VRAAWTPDLYHDVLETLLACRVIPAEAREGAFKEAVVTQSTDAPFGPSQDELETATTALLFILETLASGAGGSAEHTRIADMAAIARQRPDELSGRLSSSKRQDELLFELVKAARILLGVDDDVAAKLRRGESGGLELQRGGGGAASWSAAGEPIDVETYLVLELRIELGLDDAAPSDARSLVVHHLRAVHPAFREVGEDHIETALVVVREMAGKGVTVRTKTYELAANLAALIDIDADRNRLRQAVRRTTGILVNRQ
jgi:hypothetical protein